MHGEIMRYLKQRYITPLKSIEIYSEQIISDSVNSNTTGHKILIEDRRAENIPDSIFDRLDFLISCVKNEIPQGDNEDPVVAMEKLKSIEQTLTNNNLVCSIPIFLVPSLAEGLHQTPLRISPSEEENRNRRSHIEKHIDENFSHMDCDLSSLLYLSIAEKIGLPLCMVEVPGHNFVRWTLRDGTHINWDTNFGYNRFTDDQYAIKYDAQEEQINNGTYLSNMSTENVLGYFYFCRGNMFEGKSKSHKAIQEYLQSIEKYPQSPASRNNIAWMFVTSRDIQKLITDNQALGFAREAVAIIRSDLHLDTLACVLAQLGEFEEAITLETEAYNMNPDPTYQAMIKAFHNKQTWLDVNG